MRRIILASASPRRRELLEQAGVVFEVRPGNGDEVIKSRDPETVVKELSRQKAIQAVCPADEGTVILGADTIVAFAGKILGKPGDREDAEKTLKIIQGKKHKLFKGFTNL